jgi:hypothetical protein
LSFKQKRRSLIVKKYDAIIIPRTKSDKTEEHYFLKQFLIEYLKDKSGLPPFDYIKYDERTIKSELGFDPDVVFFRQGKPKYWIEAETDPFNIFSKIAKLNYLSHAKPKNWPEQISFITRRTGNTKNFCKSIRTFKKLSKVRKINIYIADIKEKRMITCIR